MGNLFKQIAVRIVRHAILPIITYLVATGWLPPGLEGDITELVILAVTSVFVLGWSILSGVFPQLKLIGAAIALVQKRKG